MRGFFDAMQPDARLFHVVLECAMEYTMGYTKAASPLAQSSKKPPETLSFRGFFPSFLSESN
ncbi:hypothetical protein PP636_gp53 [Arthrobacter phage Hestia]|uniref:Uncharacterized protein n=1 Tax=Arthrobacter phage Hestia TaxID=2419609 RepID=A0A3G3M3D8_9CAUD|nr:hypothetical protein PP636_gp53 [Arthrobacter phage Hestia]AYR00920.1 hypothetical protein PBI_HESTIA_42 [Arthrobacter phage Hestia]